MTITPVRDRIVRAADRTLDGKGFGTGVDALVKAAGVSTRTLYQCIGNREDLLTAVLAHRRERFFDAVRSRQNRGLAGLFEALEEWFVMEGANGCLFLRAAAEVGTGSEAVRREVTQYEAQLRAEVTKRIRYDLSICLSARSLRSIADEVLIIVKGVASMAPRIGPRAAVIGRKMADQIVATADEVIR